VAIRSCVFDLETSSLNADFGIVLCAVVKPDTGKAKVFRGDKLNPDWHERRSDDSAVVAATVEELSRYDIWIAHNGLRFDVPFLRARLMRSGLPPLPDKKLIDPCQLARNKLKVSFNSLSSLANHLGCNSKTDVTPQHWLAAALDGDEKAMSYIATHCLEDCKTLERVVEALKPYISSINTWGSAR